MDIFFYFTSPLWGVKTWYKAVKGKELKPFLRYCRVKQMPGPSVFPATNRKQHSGGERKTKPNVFKNGKYPGVVGFAIVLSSPPLPLPIPLPIPLPFPHRIFVVLCDDLSDGAVVFPWPFILHVLLNRTVNMSELRRIRRQFITYTKMHPVEDTKKIANMFVQYLNSSIQ